MLSLDIKYSMMAWYQTSISLSSARLKTAICVI